MNGPLRGSHRAEGLTMRRLRGMAVVAPSRISQAFATPQNPATAQFNVTITILKQCTVTAPSTINLRVASAPMT